MHIKTILDIENESKDNEKKNQIEMKDKNDLNNEIDNIVWETILDIEFLLWKEKK